MGTVAMLSETPNVRQIEGERRRRWFDDEDFDLIVWFGQFGRIDEFQLCYDKTSQEHAVIWKRGSGFSHYQVDVGRGALGAKPILIPANDVELDNVRVAELFREQSNQIDPRIANFVYDKLVQYRMNQQP